MKRIINNFVVAIFVLILLFACQNKNNNAENVKTEEQILQEISHVHAIGKVSPANDWAIISSNNTSERIQDILVKEGDTVKKGQELMLLESGSTELDIMEARAQLHTVQMENKVTIEELRKAQLSAKERETKYQTSQKLFVQNAETQEQVDSDYFAWQQQELEIKALQQKMAVQKASERERLIQIEKAERLLSDSRVLAPTDGIIVELSAKVGQRADHNAELGKIAQVANPIVEAEVDELFANDVRMGQEVYISAMRRNDTLAHGEVFYVSPILSDKSILYEVANEGVDRRVRKIKIRLRDSPSLAINAKVDCQIKIR